MSMVARGLDGKRLPYKALVGEEHKVVKEARVGQSNCELTYPDDVLLSPRHSSISIREGKARTGRFAQSKD